MKITVYGSGCRNCNMLEEHAKTALNNSGVEGMVEKCSDINSIAEAGILRTPGLAINGNIVSQGKVLAASKIEEMIKANLG